MFVTKREPALPLSLPYLKPKSALSSMAYERKLDLETAFPPASPLFTPSQRPDALGITSCLQCSQTGAWLYLCLCPYLHLKCFLHKWNWLSSAPTPCMVCSVVTASEILDLPGFLPLCYRTSSLMTGPMSASSLLPLCLAWFRCFTERVGEGRPSPDSPIYTCNCELQQSTGTVPNWGERG